MLKPKPAVSINLVVINERGMSALATPFFFGKIKAKADKICIRAVGLNAKLFGNL